MRRLALTLVEFTPSGGLFQFAFQLGRAMAQLGHDVELVTGPEPELQSDLVNFRVVSLLPTWHPGAPRAEARVVRKLRRVLRALRHIEGWRRLSRHLRRQPPDVVQFAALRFPVDGWFARRLADRPDRPVLADVAHSPMRTPESSSQGAPRRESLLMRRTIGAALTRMDVVFVLGERSLEELHRVWPGIRRTVVIPHGDEDVFLAGAQPAAPGTRPRLLFFGTIAPHKGVDLLLEAFSLVRARVPEAELIVAGAPTADVDVSALRRATAGQPGVRLQLGYVPVGDVPALFNAATAVVAPYRHANQSGVVHLAQTFARPVIATAVGDLPDVVIDGVTGLLVPVGDPVALALAIERLLRNPAEAARLGRQARERLASTASWTEVASRVLQVYAGLVPADHRAGVP